MSNPPSIGIDLGANNSRIAVFRNGKARKIAKIPSCVTFTKSGRLFTMQHALDNPCNTVMVFEAEQLLGRKFNDEFVQSSMKNWAFKVVNDGENRPKIEVQYMGQKKGFYPEEICAMLLTKLKETAELGLGKKIFSAVVTVPAAFNNSQRQGIKTACHIAGMHVLCTTCRLSAAAIAWGYNMTVAMVRQKNFLVCLHKSDSLNMSAVTIENSKFKTQGQSIFSLAQQSDSKDDHKFQICQYMEKFLKDTKLSKQDIHEIVLFTSIPEIQTLLNNFFDRVLTKLSKNILAQGAAIRAAIINEDIPEGTLDLSLVDVIPFSLGIETVGGAMSPFLKCNTSFMQKKTSVVSFFTDESNYPMIIDTTRTFSPSLIRWLTTFVYNPTIPTTIYIYEGENEIYAAQNCFLGKLELAPLSTAMDLIEVTFSLDSNGILEVSAINQTTGKTERATFMDEDRQFSAEEIEAMIYDAKQYDLADLMHQEKELKREFQSLQQCLKESNIREDLKDEKIKTLQLDIDTLQAQKGAEIAVLNEKIEEKEVVNKAFQAEIQEKEVVNAALQAEIEQKKIEIEQLTAAWQLKEDEIILQEQLVLGQGSYAEVKEAEFRGTKVAAKRLHRLILSDYNWEHFIREMEISSRIRHPNIVQFIGATFARNSSPILLYELMATSLYNSLQKNDKLTPSQILNICCDVTSALCYIHGWKPHPIIHRDVSSPNVLMEPNGNDRYKSKLSDFGSANLQCHASTVFPGNAAYAAPEAEYPQHHTPVMDIYSFGILMTEMILHRPPEMSPDIREQQAHTIESKSMKALVLRCIDSDHTGRITSIQLLAELKKIAF